MPACSHGFVVVVVDRANASIDGQELVKNRQRSDQSADGRRAERQQIDAGNVRCSSYSFSRLISRLRRRTEAATPALRAGNASFAWGLNLK